MIDPKNPWGLPQHIAEDFAREIEHKREEDAQRADESYLRKAQLLDLLMELVKADNRERHDG